MPGSLLCGFPQLFPEVPRETHQKETENANAKTGEWTWRNFLALRQLGRPRCTPGIGDLLKGGLHQPKVRPPSLSHNALEVKGSTLPSLLPPLAYSCSLQRKQLSEAAPTRQCRRGRQEVSPQEFRAWLGGKSPGTRTLLWVSVDSIVASITRAEGTVSEPGEVDSALTQGGIQGTRSRFWSPIPVCGCGFPHQLAVLMPAGCPTIQLNSDATWT